MQYPKQIMSISELNKLGFSKDFLYRAVHSKVAPRFAIKQGEKNSKYQIDTQEFEKYRQKGILT